MKLFKLTKISKTKDGKEIKQVMAKACDLNTLKLLIESCNDGECTFEQEEVVLQQATETPKEEKKPEVKKAKSKKEEAEEDDEEDEESGLMGKIKTGAKYVLAGGAGVAVGWLAHSVFGKNNNE